MEAIKNKLTINYINENNICIQKCDGGFTYRYPRLRNWQLDSEKQNEIDNFMKVNQEEIKNILEFNPDTFTIKQTS